MMGATSQNDGQLVDVRAEGPEDAAGVGVLQRKTGLDPHEPKAHGEDLPDGK